MGSRLTLWLCAAFIVVSFPACTTSRSSSSPAVSTLGDVATLVREAKNDLEKSDADAAIAKLQQALKADARSAEAHFLLGNAHSLKEQFGQAEAQFQEALKLDKANVDARSNLGVVYYRQGKLPEAEKAFREALAQKTQDPEIHYNLGGVLAALNKLDEALGEFRQANELDPSLAEPYLGMGSIYKLQGKRTEAVAALQEFVKRTKDPNWRGQAEQMLAELGAKP